MPWFISKDWNSFMLPGTLLLSTSNIYKLFFLLNILLKPAVMLMPEYLCCQFGVVSTHPTFSLRCWPMVTVLSCPSAVLPGTVHFPCLINGSVIFIKKKTSYPSVITLVLLPRWNSRAKWILQYAGYRDVYNVPNFLSHPDFIIGKWRSDLKGLSLDINRMECGTELMNFMTLIEF